MLVLDDASEPDDHHEGDLQQLYHRVHYVHPRRLLDLVGPMLIESDRSFYDKETENNTRSTKIVRQNDRSAHKELKELVENVRRNLWKKSLSSLAEGNSRDLVDYRNEFIFSVLCLLFRLNPIKLMEETKKMLAFSITSPVT